MEHIKHTYGNANECSSSSPSSCGAYLRSSIPHGVFPAQRSIPAPRSTESLRSERAGNGKHTPPLIATCADSLLQGGPLYSGSSSGHGSSPLTSSGRPAVSTTRRDGGSKPSHAALLSELPLDQGQNHKLTETHSLHATPMWLIALYVPAMAPINYYWIPPQW